MSTSVEITLPDDLLDYLCKIYEYRLKFYELSENQDPEIHRIYQLFTLDREMVAFLHELQLGKNVETHSITIDYNEPLSVVQKQLAEFTVNIMAEVKAKYDDYRFFNQHIEGYLQNKTKWLQNSAFILKDVARKSDNSQKPIEFEALDECIEVFKLHEHQNMPDKQIVFELGFLDTSNGEFSDIELRGKLNKVKNHLKQAKLYIKSAENGIFPQI